MNKIKIIKHSENCYEADPIYQCGSPVVGRGRTPLQAVINLFRCSDKFDFEIVDGTGEALEDIKKDV